MFVATLSQQEGLPIRVETPALPWAVPVVLSTAKGESGLESVELSRDDNKPYGFAPVDQR